MNKIVPFNLQRSLMQDPFMGLRIELSQAIYLSDRPSGWRADISRRRLARSGREGRPEDITTIVTNDGESPADLLRTLATLYEQGDVSL